MLYFVEIGKNIVYLRNKRGITQEQLALRAAMSVSYLRIVEHSLANPTIDVLDRLARVLDVPLPMLLIVSFSDKELLEMVHKTRTDLEIAGQKEE